MPILNLSNKLETSLSCMCSLKKCVTPTLLVFPPEAGVRVEPCFFMTTEKFYIFPNTVQLLSLP